MMKKLFMACVAMLALAACGKSGQLTVTVTNSLPMERQGEMVELSMSEVASRLALEDTAQIVVLDEENRQVPYQITHDEKLIFPASVAAEGSSVYTIRVGMPDAVSVKAVGKVYPRRMDDLAWENDLVAFRAYGPGLQATGERGFGYDLFTKRGTDEPVLEELYAHELDTVVWNQIYALRKTDRKAADELQRTVTYHVDHGYGMDCYAVGPTLGAGVAALVNDGEIVYPWCYKTCEILDNGPLRFSARLEFTPLQVGTDTAVIETRLITLDAGSHLNRTVVSYANLTKAHPIVTGIVLHDTTGAITADAANGYITYTDPTTGPDNGQIFLGAAFPAQVDEAKTVRFSADEKKNRNNAEGHVLAYSQYEPATEYVYYWGFGWSRADVKDEAAWKAYMADFANKVRHPLGVTMN